MPLIICTKFVLGNRTDVFGSPSDAQICFQGISKYIPPRILEYFGATSSNPRLVRMRESRSITTSVAKQMVEDKAEMLLQGKGSRDVFSLLGGCTTSFQSSKSDKSIVKANMDADAKAKLTDEELFAQMRWVQKMLHNIATY